MNDPCDCIGLIEASAILGVTRQRAYQLSKTPAFPAPTRTLGAGRLWSEAAVEQYAATRSRTPGPVPKPRHNGWCGHFHGDCETDCKCLCHEQAKASTEVPS
jgi:predicted DNA-binding transcriptional regulator AlpA